MKVSRRSSSLHLFLTFTITITQKSNVMIAQKAAPYRFNSLDFCLPVQPASLVENIPLMLPSSHPLLLTTIMSYRLESNPASPAPAYKCCRSIQRKCADSQILHSVTLFITSALAHSRPRFSCRSVIGSRSRACTSLALLLLSFLFLSPLLSQHRSNLCTLIAFQRHFRMPPLASSNVRLLPREALLHLS